MANEDTSFEFGLCELTKPKHILAICGSGARFLPLASTRPLKITALDLATQQLALADLRYALMRDYPLDTYLRFFGYPPYDTQQHKEERASLFAQLKLKESTRSYFQQLFEHLSWQGLLYEGRWEKTFIGISEGARRFAGKRYHEIFQFLKKGEQDSYFAAKLKSRSWCFIPAATLFFIGNATFFNAFLYKGSFVRKNIPSSYFEFYASAFKRLFAQALTRENFFLQICFLGRLQYPEGNPLEVRPDVYAQAQKALQEGTAIELLAQDVITHASQTNERYDFVSMSNVPSYFAPPIEQEYLQKLKLCLQPGALVVVRCYLRVPEQVDTSGYEDVSALYQELAAAEKMQMYKILVYRYLG